MGKQSRSKKLENFGKGKVTPMQVAFIVDRYLFDNNYSVTRSVFRNEASSLISKSPVREAPSSLLSLGAMLDEYICLKEQKVILEQERLRWEEEKCRVHTLLQGMQNVMNGYNASASGSVPMIPNAPAAPKAVVAAPPSATRCGSLPGHPVSVSSTPKAMREQGSFSSPLMSQVSSRKRRSSEVVIEPSSASKKTRSKTTFTKLTDQGIDNAINNQLTARPSSVDQSSPQYCAANELTVQVSSVAKCLFNQTQLSPLSNSSDPYTPSQSSETDKSVAPIGIPSTANCSKTREEITPTNYPIISTERARLTPLKKTTCYTIERNNCISSCSPAKTNLKRLGKRDHVKGRLDFGDSDEAVNLDQSIADDITTSASEKQAEADYFDMDFPLDAFGENFFSELLVDLDLGCEGIGYPCQPTPCASGDTMSRSSHESGFLEKERYEQGPETVTSMKSITKCIRILSPAKGGRNSL